MISILLGFLKKADNTRKPAVLPAGFLINPAEKRDLFKIPAE